MKGGRSLGRERWSAVLRLVAGCVLIAGAGGAQDRPRDAFEDDLSVLEVLVPAEVILDGLPVEGLGVGDFEVSVGGREVIVVAVDEVRQRASERGRVAGEEPPLEGDPEALAEVPVALVVLVVDASADLGTRLAQWLPALRGMALSQAGTPGRPQLFCLVIKGTAGWVALSGLTNEPRQLGAAFDLAEAMLARSGVGAALGALDEAVAGESGSRRLLESPFGALGREGGPMGVLANRFGIGAGQTRGGTGVDVSIQSTGGGSPNSGDGYAASVLSGALDGASATSAMYSAEDFADSLAGLIDVFGQAPGLKKVLFVGDGPSSVGLGLDGAAGSRLGGAAVQATFERTFTEFQESGWKIDALAFRGADALGLHYMASETGGKVVSGAGGPQNSVAAYVAESSVAYVLAVRIPGELAGRKARIEVRVPGLPRRAKVFHRRHYRPREG